MKTAAMLGTILLLGSGAWASAQVVDNRAPSIVPAQYNSATSPLGDGRVVTTYYVPQTSAVQTVVSPPTSQPYRVEKSNPQIYTYPSITTTNYAGQTLGAEYYTPANTATAPIQTIGSSVVGVGNPCGCSPGPAAVGYSPVTYAPANAYRPLVPLRNGVPPGTYIGQGLVGQPKAYVEGQSIRNFFRYVLP